MKEAGLNISGFCKAEDLPAVEKAGLSCFVSDPTATGYDWENLPARAEMEKNAAELSAKIGGSKAALGYLLQDEPTAAMLPGITEVSEIFRQKMPTLWPYVNGLPFSAGRKLIGNIRYEDYLRTQVQKIGQPFLSYDEYALKDGVIGDGFFANLEIARRISLELKAPFWSCILAATVPSFSAPTEASLSVQAYSTLAYGGRGISYFTYLHPDQTDFTETAIDGFGNRTPTWEMLRRLNGEILTLVPTLIKLHSTDVFYYPSSFEPDQTESLVVESVYLSSLKSSVPPKLIVGEFADDEGKKFLMLVNRNLTAAVQVRIKLVDGDSKLERLSPFSGEMEPVDPESGLLLASGGGALLAIK